MTDLTPEACQAPGSWRTSIDLPQLFDACKIYIHVSLMCADMLLVDTFMACTLSVNPWPWAAYNTSAVPDGRLSIWQSCKAKTQQPVQIS